MIKRRRHIRAIARRAWGWLLRTPAAMAAALSVAALACYLTPIHSYRGDDAGGDTGSVELLPIAILQYHALDFDAVLQAHPDLMSGGTSGGELPYYLWRQDGRAVSFYPIVPGLMNVPAYAVARALGLDLFRWRFALSMVTAAAVSAASVGFMYLALHAIVARPATAVGFAALYAVGTDVWSVAARNLVQHGPSVLLIAAALAVILRGGQRFAPAAGFLLGLAVWNRPTNALIAGPLLACVAIRHWRVILSLAAATAVPAALMAAYSYLYCGSVLHLGQGRQVIADLSDPGGALRAPALAGLAGLLFNPNRGLLVFSPVFAAGAAFLAVAAVSPRGDGLHRAMAVGVALMLAVYARWVCWWGGDTVAYRLLTELVPTLTIGTALAWDRCLARFAVGRAAVLVAAAWSVYVNTLAAVYYPTTQFNGLPDHLSDTDGRLWNVRDGEIARDQRMLAADLLALAHGRRTWDLSRLLPPVEVPGQKRTIPVTSASLGVALPGGRGDGTFGLGRRRHDLRLGVGPGPARPAGRRPAGDRRRRGPVRRCRPVSGRPARGRHRRWPARVHGAGAGRAQGWVRPPCHGPTARVRR